MTRTIALLALGALALLLFLRSSPGGPASAEEAPRRETQSPAPEMEGDAVDLAAFDVEGDAGSRAVPEHPAAEPVAAADDDEVETQEPVDDGLAHVVGRFLLPDGSPAVGAALTVEGWVANSDRVQKYGKPENWVSPSGVTGPDGRFDLAFDPPRAFQFILNAELEGHAGLSWRWSSLDPGGRTDVGNQTFRRACTVEGRVVRPDGSPTGIQWFIYADSQAGASGAGSDETRVMGPADQATGAFKLDGVPPGRVTLKAYSQSANWLDGPSVTARLGEVARAEIVYDGPDIGSSITVRTFCRPFHIFSKPRDGRILARAADGTEYEATKIAGSSQSYRIEDLPPGSYTVEIESAVHEPWSKANVQVGETVDAHLSGGARVALSVVDDGTGAPIERYRVRLRFDRSRWSPNVFEIQQRGAEPPAGGLFEKLIPWESTLLVSAEGYAEAEVPLGLLVAQTTTNAEARLKRGASIEVVVEDSTGAPVEGAKVTLHPYFEGYDPSDVFSGPRDQSARQQFRARTRDERTDGRGLVRFGQAAAGEWGLQTAVGALRAASDKVVVEEGGLQRVTLTLPASGSLRGRLTGGAPGAFEGLVVRAVSKTGDGRGSMAGRRQQIPEGTVDAEGRFFIDGLLAGPNVLTLRQPETEVPSGPNSSSMSRSLEVPLGEVELRAGGETTATVDASEAVPGVVEFEVTINGEPVAGALVKTAAMNAFEGAQTDVNGRVTFDPLLPGEWKVSVQVIGERWRHEVEAPLQLEPGGQLTSRVEIVVGAGRLRVLDAESGEPRGSQEIFMGRFQSLRTDEDGWLELTLTKGTYSFTARDPFSQGGEAPVVQVIWGPEGPEVQEIRL